MSVTEALEAWAGFPVHAATRPLVITGPLLDGAGFATDEAKIAFSERRLEIADGVPAAAATSLISEIGPLTAGPGQVLGVLDAARIRHAVHTDRGHQELDAWSFVIGEALGPVIVVEADERARMWPDLDRRYGAGTAQHLDPSGTRLRLTFVGSPRRYDDYAGAEVTESETAVAVSPRRSTTGRGGGVRLAYAETRDVEFSLLSPLGSRVLIGVNGHPIEVIDAGGRFGQAPRS